MKPRFDALAWTRGRTTVLVWMWLTCCVVGKVAFGDRTIPSDTTVFRVNLGVGVHDRSHCMGRVCPNLSPPFLLWTSFRWRKASGHSRALSSGWTVPTSVVVLVFVSQRRGASARRRGRGD
jgi:hypothetical protein